MRKRNHIKEVDNKQKEKSKIEINVLNFSGGREENRRWLCAFITRIFMGGDSVNLGGYFRSF